MPLFIWRRFFRSSGAVVPIERVHEATTDDLWYKYSKFQKPSHFVCARRESAPMPLQRGRGGGGGVSRSDVVTGRRRELPARSAEAALNTRDALRVFLACAVFRIFNA